jgi:hypothetical protein
MAETAGLVIGAVGLAGLFSTAIDCFEHVRIAKTFDRDFATAQLLLDEASLRLSRWGVAIGIDTVGLEGLAEDKAQRAEKLLIHICKLFSQAEENFDLFGDKSAATFDANADLSRTQRAVRRGITTKVHKRIGRVRDRGHNLVERTKWAVTRKNDLDSLIAGIIQGVTNLELLLPGPEQKFRLVLRREAELEVTEIHEVAESETDNVEITKADVVETLGEAAAGIDPQMEVVKKIIEALKPELQGSGTTYNVSQRIERVDQNQGIVSAYAQGNSINYHGR